jgi:HlyD family secretion protein
MNRWVIIIVALVVIIGGIWIWKDAHKNADEKTPYRLGVADRGTVETVVTATGTVSAVTTVQVGTQVSGTILNLYVDFNSPVHKGEIIARLDPTSLQTTVKQSQASLDQAKAQLAQAQRDLDRTKDLYDKKLAAQSDYDTALTAVDVAKANVESAEANLDRAKINLAYSVIASPTDGTVISRNVDVGQTVAASLQAPTLFTIAQDLRQMQVEADIDEADIGGLKEGMDATFTVDAFPDEPFHGTIKQIRYASATTQGVVTYPVIISVSNPDLKLRPGMTANVSIITAQRDDVLRVPAIAARFRPPNAPEQPMRERAVSDTTQAQRQRGQGGGIGGGHGGQGHGQWQGHGQGQGQDSTGTKNGGAERRARRATLWVKGPDGKPQPHMVTIGLNDGNHVEIVSGDISAGDSVIVGMMGGTASASSSSNRMPGFGGPMGPGRH